MRKLNLITTFGLLVYGTSTFIATSLWADDEYYTWVDENGVTNYAERSPQGYDAQHITRTANFRFGYSNETNPEPVFEAQEDEEVDPLVEAGEQDSRDIDEYIAKEKERIDGEIARAKESNCNIGKLNLAQLTNYNRIRVEGDDGEIRVLTDAEKQRRIADAQQTIKENC